MNTLLNLVATNYAMRTAGVLADEWFWADCLLCGKGIYINWPPK